MNILSLSNFMADMATGMKKPTKVGRLTFDIADNQAGINLFVTS